MLRFLTVLLYSFTSLHPKNGITNRFKGQATRMVFRGSVFQIKHIAISKLIAKNPLAPELKRSANIVRKNE